MKLRTLAIATAVAAVPLASHAALISGQLDIVGAVNVDNSSFIDGGFVDFDPNQSAGVIIAEGDFAAFSGTTFDLFDVTLSGTQLLYSGDGLTFTANEWFGFDDDASDGDRSFMARGVLQLAGYDDTPALFSFSTQENNPNQVRASFSSTTTATPIPLPASVLMLMGALGGLAFLGRSRSA